MHPDYHKTKSEKASSLKTLRKIVLSTVILMAVFLIGGLAYALLTNTDSAKPAAKPKADTAAITEPVVKPAQPNPNAPEGVAVYMNEDAVKAGSNTGVTARTNPGSACTITATYNGVASTDSGLAPKTADPYGSVSWTWTVGGSVPPGKWPVKVVCIYHGRTGVSVADQVVVR